MTVMRLPRETLAASCGEAISHLAEALLQAGLYVQPALCGVRILDASTLNAGMAGPAVRILVFCGAGRPAYLVQTALAPLEWLAREAMDGAIACLAVQCDLQVAAELVLALDDAGTCRCDGCDVQALTPLDDDMAAAVLRLLKVFRHPADALVLGPGLVRELLYRVLTGPQGGAVRAVLGKQGSMRRIGKALRRIREAYADALDVAALAREAGMSIAAFHAHFKTVTQTTPIQFLKNTRLQQARLMMREGFSAAHASRLVGYESTSQFSREFKRLFGRTPTQEAARTTAVSHPADTRRSPRQIEPRLYREVPAPVRGRRRPGTLSLHWE